MKKILVLICLFFALFSQAQTNCASAAPFCANNQSGVTFPATVNGPPAQSGPSYGCLGSQPNPAWYYLQISQSGNLDLFIAGTGNQDVDFICWGPFTNFATICNNLTANNIVDCSFSGSPTETCNINNAVVGQYYMVLITNFSGAAQNIIFNQIGGTAATNCGLVTNNTAICAGKTATLVATPPANWTNVSYSINPGGQSSPTPTFFVSPTVTTSYTLFVSGLNNQGIPSTNTAVSTVTVLAQPSFAPTFTQATCATNTNAVNLGLSFNPNNPIPSYTLNWSPLPQTLVNTGVPPITATNAAAGGNTVAIVSAGGCTAVATFTILNVTPPTLTLSNLSSSFSITCSSPSVCISASTTPSNANLFWINSSNTFTSNAASNCLLNAGNYTVVATGPTNTCVVTQTFAVVTNTTPPASVVAPLSQTINCVVNASAVFTNNITSPTVNVQTSWFCPSSSFPNSPSSVIQGAVSIYSAFCGSGTYTVVTENLLNGCKTTSFTSVTTTSSSPIFNVTSTTNFSLGCAPNNTTTLCMAGGTTTNGAIKFFFSAPNSTTVFPLPVAQFNTVQCISTSVPGIWTLSAIDNVSSCQAHIPVTVLLNTVQPNISYSIPTLTLNCNNPTLVATATSTTPNTTIQWQYPQSGPNTLSTNTIAVGPATGPATSTAALTYGNYTLTITDGNNQCKSVQIMPINQDFRPPIISPATTNSAIISCKMPTVQITIVNAVNAGQTQNIPITQSTLVASNYSSTGTSFIIPQVGIYTITATSIANGCVSNPTFVTVSPDFNLPVVGGSPNGILDCASVTGASAAVQVVLQTTLSAWSVAFKAYPQGTSFSPAAFGIAPNGGNCPPNSLASPTIVVDQPGVYEFFVRNNTNGCITTSSLLVLPGTLNANFAPSTTSGFAPLEVKFNNTSASSATAGASSGIQSVWNFGNGVALSTTNTSVEQTAVYANPGTYTVLLVASKGTCIDSTYKVIVVDIPSKLDVPNVFTPNGDKSNDVFFLKTTNLSEISALIFDRWGNKVYDLVSTTGNIAWDGKNQAGIECANGTYFYIIKAKGKDGTEYEKKGQVSLFR